MAKVYLISCRDAGVDCDFQARGSSLDEVMQLCADHGAREHMKGFGPDLYRKMRSCMKTWRKGHQGRRAERPGADERQAPAGCPIRIHHGELSGK
jgi:predicted small metal-binding protein